MQNKIEWKFGLALCAVTFLIALLALAIILPDAAFGQAKATTGYSETRSEVAGIPAKAVEDTTSKRLNVRQFVLSDTGKVQQRMAIIGTGPISRITEASADSKSGYSKRVDIGQSVFNYDSTGRMHWQKGKCWIELTPLFDTEAVRIEQIWHGNGVKENIYRDTKKSPTRLEWALEQSEPGLAKRRLEPFTATDADGQSVAVKVFFTDTRLIVEVPENTAVIDPSIQDTMAGTATDTITAYIASENYALNDAGWYGVRYHAAPAAFTGDMRAEAHYSAATERLTFYRSFLWFDLAGLGLSAVIVDSARLFINVDGASLLFGTGDSVVSIQGTWTGKPTRASYRQFDGYNNTDSSAFVFTKLLENIYVDSNATGWKSGKFTAAGCDTIEALLSDTLRLVLLNANDAYDIKEFTYRKHNIQLADVYHNLIIYYNVGEVSGPASVAGVASPSKVSGVSSPSKVSGVN